MRFSAQELFLHRDIPTTFERFQMACEISVRHIQQILEGIEVYVLIHHQYRHNPQADLILKSLIEIFQYFSHDLCLTSIRIP